MEVDIKKIWYDSAVVQLKLGGVNLESPDFIAEHGIGFVVRLKGIIDKIWAVTAPECRKFLETGFLSKSFDARTNRDEPLVEFFLEYGVDYVSATELLKKGESYSSKMYENIMKQLCKQLLEKEQI